MAVSCTAHDLVAGANCYCAIPEGRKIDVLISLFAQIADVTTDAKTLLEGANCLCGIPEGRKMDVLIYLACAIVNGGSGGAVCILGGVGPPAMTVPCDFSAYVELPGPNNGLWLGNATGSTNWDNVIAQGP